ncbi:hypothetical protein LWI28_005964 [Acer negundo]|uniref:Uncharacterized protein n=1 Tax=Acer negundo TaxID=4023 RepID=A0AAD5I581_ACENE|nr:hypothetical protein LWI28_005964 [Acer negundo]
MVKMAKLTGYNSRVLFMAQELLLHAVVVGEGIEAEVEATGAICVECADGGETTQMPAKGPSGFSWSSTAEEVTQGVDGTGLTAIVTGASSGILRETARVLALRGVHVTMAVRNMAAGRDVKEEIVKEIAGGKVDVMESDLCSMASIRKFALEFNTKSLPLNLLVYSIFGAYGQSKLANILHANELAKRLKSAATTGFVALHPQVKGISGEYFSDSNLAKTNAQARNVDLAKKLWDFSMDLIK